MRCHRRPDIKAPSHRADGRSRVLSRHRRREFALHAAGRCGVVYQVGLLERQGGTGSGQFRQPPDHPPRHRQPPVVGPHRGGHDKPRHSLQIGRHGHRTWHSAPRRGRAVGVFLHQGAPVVIVITSQQCAQRQAPPHEPRVDPRSDRHILHRHEIVARHGQTAGVAQLPDQPACGNFPRCSCRRAVLGR